jgi:hypothetical protein
MASICEIKNPADWPTSCDLGVLDLALMGDSALRLGHCTIDELAEAAAPRRRGAPMLRRIIGFLDQRSESPWESVMRILHQAAEIPVEPQHVVLDHWGRFVARGDLRIVGTTGFRSSMAVGIESLTSRRWDPERLRRWNALIADSMLGPPGRARALRYWRLA